MAEYLGWQNVFATTNVTKQNCVYNIPNILDASPGLDAQK